MGRFTDQELLYQKHIYTAEEKLGIRRSTLELVSPRQKIYAGHLIVLVGYWTGSMGEGMAIGFDSMKKATIMGTKMAGLLGEIYSFETPETKITFSFPCVNFSISTDNHGSLSLFPVSDKIMWSLAQRIFFCQFI